jgi:predicted N-acyltransferase
MPDKAMELRFVGSMSEVKQKQWNDMLDSSYPFLRHEFLLALEQSKSVTAKRGWQPCHALAYLGKTLQGAMPLYIKSHPYGEYVFDHAWENAFSRYGIPYYPKLLTAIPFTPVRGPRYIVAPESDRSAVLAALFGGTRELLKKHAFSSWHVLYPDATTKQELTAHEMTVRDGVNFFWQNRDYQKFEDFLGACSARKRKNIRKEREHVAAQGIRFRIAEGTAICKEDWDFFYHCYQATYAKRSGHGGYLTREFFEHTAKNFSDRALIFIAERMGNPVGAALSFRSEDTLYGRYWGCIQEIDKLHFETCYYQHIEYCIANRIQHLDGGVQGEHKIRRGFEPTTTHSCHWIENPDFRKVINNFLTEESEHMAAYKDHASEYLPFKKNQRQ